MFKGHITHSNNPSNMKFKSIGNQSNISSNRSGQSNRFSSLSPSMKLDSMGFSHVSWITVKNGHNEINYKYWNGDKWDFIGDNSIVSKSKDSIYYSPNGIALTDDDSPILAFVRKDINTNNRICVARVSYGEWSFDELEVGYDIKWIGAFFYRPKFEWSSSSNSSLSSDTSVEINSTSSNSSLSSDTSVIESRSSLSSFSSFSLSSFSLSSFSSDSNSSSSKSSVSSASSIKIYSTSSRSSVSSIEINSTSSNSSNSSIEIYSTSSDSSRSSESSSSLDSSSSSSSRSLSSKSSLSSSSESSSSIDSSSSSSADNKDIYIATYDSTTIRIYSLSSVWELVGQKDEEIIDFSSFKCVSVGDKIGFTCVKDENVIRYNFFDLNAYYWAFSSFKDVASSITTGKIISLGVNGFLRIESEFGGPRIYMSWIEDVITPYIQSYIKGCYVTENEEEVYWQIENSVFQNYIDLEQLTYISSISASVSAAHRVIGTCAYIHNDLNGDPDYYPIIFVSGAKTSVFLYRWIVPGGATTYPWKEYKVDLGYTGTAIPKNIETIFDEISGKIKVIFDDNNSSIIYTENEIGLDTQTSLALENDAAFDIETPKIVILNDAGVYISNWKDGGLTDGSNVNGVSTSSKGVVLRDSVNPIAIVDDVIIENEEDNSFSYSSSSSDQSASESSLSSVGICIGPVDTNISYSTMAFSSTFGAYDKVYLHQFRSGSYPISVGEYNESIADNCSSTIYLKWVADVNYTAPYALRRYNNYYGDYYRYYLFAYMKNADNYITATVRHAYFGGPYIAYYTNENGIPFHPNPTLNWILVDGAGVQAPNYEYSICPLTTPFLDPYETVGNPYPAKNSYTPAEAYSLKTTLDLLVFGQPELYMKDSEYIYHDILWFNVIPSTDPAHPALSGYTVFDPPTTDDLTNPTEYWLPHLDGNTLIGGDYWASEPNIHYGW